MTRSGSLVAPRTCSVTLPSASRCKPPRPWVAIAIRSQLPNIAVPSDSESIERTYHSPITDAERAVTHQSQHTRSTSCQQTYATRAPFGPVP